MDNTWWRFYQQNILQRIYVYTHGAVPLYRVTKIEVTGDDRDNEDCVDIYVNNSFFIVYIRIYL